MVLTEERLKSLAVDLYQIGAIKFGEFETKSGLSTPVYFDLRVIVSFRKLLDTVGGLIGTYLEEDTFDVICGVPLTALPIASAVGLRKGIPMVIRDKEAGTIDGQFNAGANCLIIEDVVTSGSSVLETATDLRSRGINCRYAVVLLNREQGGGKILEENGIKMHALLNLTQLMVYLEEAGCIDGTTVEKVKQYLKTTQVSPKAPLQSNNTRLGLTFNERAKCTKNPIAKRLFEIMESKQTNLCASLLTTNYENFCYLIHKLGPHVCLLLTFVEVIGDAAPEKVRTMLLEAAAKYDFLICEDKQFCDIGKTVQLQYKSSSWAHAVTVDCLMGKGILNAIKESEGLPERGVFLAAETSASRNLMDADYTKATIELAEEYPDLVAGIESQNQLFADHPAFIQLTHDVKLDFEDGAANVCADIVINKGADVVVAKQITDSIVTYKKDALEQNANLLKKNLWEAYLKRFTL